MYYILQSLTHYPIYQIQGELEKTSDIPHLHYVILYYTFYIQVHCDNHENMFL